LKFIPNYVRDLNFEEENEEHIKSKKKTKFLRHFCENKIFIFWHESEESKHK